LLNLFEDELLHNLLLLTLRNFFETTKMKLFLFSLITLAGTTSFAQNNTTKIKNMTDTATFGTGCFWCTEAVFQQLEGVEKVTSGYSGGFTENPNYKDVCTGTTGHAECLNVVYDPSKISFDDLLEVFWQVHDPTTLNRQGNDIGTQYRSTVFFHNGQQKATTEKYIKELDKTGAWANPIVTKLEPFIKFYPAEDYHQNYYNNNTGQGYCQFVIRPKVEKFQKVFKVKLKKHN
jgi:peptide-methionine (S)-S-oxide reductase